MSLHHSGSQSLAAACVLATCVCGYYYFTSAQHVQHYVAPATSTSSIAQVAQGTVPRSSLRSSTSSSQNARLSVAASQTDAIENSQPMSSAAQGTSFTTITIIGTVATALLAYAWGRLSTSSEQRALAASQHNAEWSTMALELEDGFPGPGNPEDEFEVTVVWGGEERTLKIKGDESILMACEEAGLNVPSLCRHGVCLECTGKVEKGIENARRDSQCHNDDNVAEGYICTCSTYVGGNGMKVQMGMMEEAYKKQFGKFEAEEKAREEKKKKSFLG